LGWVVLGGGVGGVVGGGGGVAVFKRIISF